MSTPDVQQVELLEPSEHLLFESIVELLDDLDVPAWVTCECLPDRPGS